MRLWLVGVRLCIRAHPAMKVQTPLLRMSLRMPLQGKSSLKHDTRQSRACRRCCQLMQTPLLLRLMTRRSLCRTFERGAAATLTRANART